MQEAGMQQGSLIRSNRKRGPDVWQFRWADRGPQGKRIYRKRVIGTVCQYPDADSARKSVTGLLRELTGAFTPKWLAVLRTGRAGTQRAGEYGSSPIDPTTPAALEHCRAFLPFLPLRFEGD